MTAMQLKFDIELDLGFDVNPMVRRISNTR